MAKLSDITIKRFNGDKSRALEFHKEVLSQSDKGLHEMYISCKGFLKKYPDDPVVLCTFAALHGDMGHLKSEKLKKKFKKEAVEILSSLMRKRKLSIELKDFIKNEYFFHSNRFRDQYKLGLDRIRAGREPSGVSYSAGVGATCYGYELLKRGQRKRAQYFGIEACKHWEGMSRRSFDKLFYCLALAISKKQKSAEKLLEKELKRSKFRKSELKLYFEVKKDLEIIKKLYQN